MLIKIGIAILILAIFGPMIGEVILWGQDVMFDLLFWLIDLPDSAIFGIIVFFVVLRIFRWIIRR